MYSKEVKKGTRIYGYSNTTDDLEVDPDILDLFKTASANKQKLVVMGGLHGYNPSGEPTGQSDTEKGVCSFVRQDMANKGLGKGVNFIYKNLAIYTTNGSDVSIERQSNIADLITQYSANGYYVLLSWCFSENWIKAYL